MMNKRGVYFFVIDAFLGGAIVMISLLVILSSYNAAVNQESPLTLLEDFLSYIQGTQVRDFQGNYTQSLIQGGNITNPRLTIFEQVADFHYHNNLTEASNFMAEVVGATLPSQMNIRYVYDGTVIYQKARFPLQTSGLALSSKKIAMIPINRTTSYGPHLVEVTIWTS